MGGDVTISSGPAAGCLHGCAFAAGGAAPGLVDARGLAVAALVSWLITEALGAYMLANWIASSGPRRKQGRSDAVRRSESVPRSVIFGHAGLAFTGFVCWVSFLASGSAVLAWLALGFLAPAIGLGISTVTLWTPYPVRRADNEPRGGAPPGGESSGGEPGGGEPRGGEPGGGEPGGGEPRGGEEAAAGLGSDEAVLRALSDEALTRRLVDDLLASMLAAPAQAPRRRTWDLAPIIPAGHGVMAIVTFLLAMLAAIAAI